MYLNSEITKQTETARVARLGKILCILEEEVELSEVPLV